MKVNFIIEEIISRAAELAGTGRDFALATVISRDGSAPRGPGAKMLVESCGAITGTVGGGLVEAEVIKNCTAAIVSGQSSVNRYILSDESKAGLDMTCGGEARVLIQYVSAGDASVFCGDRADELPFLVTLARVEDDYNADVSFRLSSGVSSGEESEVFGEYSKILSQAYEAGSAYSSCIPDDKTILIVEALRNMHCVYICGCGHVGLKTAELAHFAGFDTVVIDDREEYANAKRFPFAREVIVAPDYAGLFSSSAAPVGRGIPGARGYIVILTRGHSYDETVLAQALETDTQYIGMIGSRGKIRKIYDNLRAGGVSDEALARVYAPIGLSISAETPAEIAVSIVAELIQCKAEPGESGARLVRS